MSVLRHDSIKVIAESIGLPNLSNELAGAMAPDVEYRMREIIQAAKKFMVHSRRSRLCADDINAALRLRNVEPLYGYSVTSSSDPSFTRVPNAPDLFCSGEREVSLDDVVNAPLPAAPPDVSFALHWLLIEGIQPAIPQNPSRISHSQSQSHPPPASNAATAQPPAARGPSFFETSTPAPATAATHTEDGVPVEVKPLVKHVLSHELQLYFETITRGVCSSDPELRQSALHSLQHDPGLHQLVPYFSRFVSEKVTHNLRNLDMLFAAVRTAAALIKSAHVGIEPYLHQLMPAILTCVVGKRLCASPSEDHWALRRTAADLVAYVCRRFGHAYHELQPRVTKTLLHALLDPSRPLTTHFGAIVGLCALGHYVVRLLLIPNVTAYYRILEPHLSPPTASIPHPPTNDHNGHMNSGFSSNSSSSGGGGGAVAMVVDGMPGGGGTGTGAAVSSRRAQQNYLDAQRVYEALLHACGQYIYALRGALDQVAGGSGLPPPAAVHALSTDRALQLQLPPDFAEIYSQIYAVFGENLRMYTPATAEPLRTVAL
eukprot:gnl/Spiro4/14570_TR7852_c0_g1_i1.p1 gnl/Spiro4/14570_TR7852_c0_g1~~gnl/Spiro4/14570_TR7852_c0_g1_i1.p1  ORF type:complete len:564 (-),score=137.22 gnl/Spiro4/14570_TR7852_c0_g1_i1:8-1639(-)